MSSLLGAGAYQYPPPTQEEELFYGVFPVDFLLEVVLRTGLDWFRTDPKAPKLVFGQLLRPVLSKYGEAKINEIADFIKKYDIKIVQSFTLIPTSVPCISIQLLDADEMTDRAGLSDFQGVVDVKNQEMEIKGRSDVGYSPIVDNIHLGIHVENTPDLAKYLYYLVVYILNAYKPQLEGFGMMLGTFRATDLSRMNEYMPENMYSRFINFTIFSLASFDKGSVPIIDNFTGINLASSSDGAAGVDCFGVDSDEPVKTEDGLTICTIINKG